MQKWEYLELTALYHNSNGEEYYSINGQRVGQNGPNGGQNGPNIYQYITQLGDDGWELVDRSGGISNPYTSSSWVFKRPKP